MDYGVVSDPKAEQFYPIQTDLNVSFILNIYWIFKSFFLFFNLMGEIHWMDGSLLPID